MEQERQQRAVRRFEDDPVAYAKTLYEEYEEHNEGFQDLVDENWEFFYGHDEELDDRAQDDEFVRSAKYIPEAQPAINTVKSAFIDALHGDETPIRLIDRNEQYPHELIREREIELNDAARRAGLLTKVMEDLLMAGACQPLAALKTGWQIDEGPKFEKRVNHGMTGFMSWVMDQIGMHHEEIAETYGTISEGPFCEAVGWDQFLYDPTIFDFTKGRGVIFRMDLHEHQVRIEAGRSGWHPNAVSRLLDEAPYTDEDEGESAAGDDDDLKRHRDDDRYRRGKYMVCEFWLPVTSKQGETYTHVYALGNNKIPLLPGRLGARSGMGPLRYPFIAYRTMDKFREMEGIPLMSQIKDLARLYNDCFNMFADAFSFGIFPVTAVPPEMEWEEQPAHFPGALWYVKDPTKISVIQQRLGDLSILLKFAEMLADKIRQIVNAPDISQGIPGTEQEKATKTIQRAQATAMRTRGIFKPIGDLMITAAQHFMYLFQASGRVDWLLDVEIDVPALTNVYPIQVEQQIWMSALEMAQANNPLYSTPMGMIYLQAIQQRVFEKLRIKNPKDYVVSREHVEVMFPATVAIDHEADKLRQTRQELDRRQQSGGVSEATPAGGEERPEETIPTGG